MSNTETINIVETLETQVAPAKAAIAERWFANRKARIDEMTQTSIGGMTRCATSAHAHRNGCAAERDFNPFADSWDKGSRNRYEDDLVALFDRSTDYVDTTETERGIMHLATFTPKSDAYLREQAAEFAELSWCEYLAKMSSKFEKIGVLAIEIIGEDPILNVLKVEAVNGVTFTVDNSVVVKVSERGNLFSQFPARFGQVKKDGVSVKNAASQKHVEELAS